MTRRRQVSRNKLQVTVWIFWKYICRDKYYTRVILWITYITAQFNHIIYYILHSLLVENMHLNDQLLNENLNSGFGVRSYQYVKGREKVGGGKSIQILQFRRIAGDRFQTVWVLQMISLQRHFLYSFSWDSCAAAYFWFSIC